MNKKDYCEYNNLKHLQEWLTPEDYAQYKSSQRLYEWFLKKNLNKLNTKIKQTQKKLKHFF